MFLLPAIYFESLLRLLVRHSVTSLFACVCVCLCERQPASEVTDLLVLFQIETQHPNYFQWVFRSA